MKRPQVPLAILLTVASFLSQAALADMPAGAPPSRLLQRVLDLVNQARAQGQRCGVERLPPAAPLQPSKALQSAATAHARDMARHSYLEHHGRDGSQPKDRVRRAGYRPRLTGENIAFGPETAEEVVAGWLSSPGHCANLMDARFREMGVAVAQGARRGHFYWVQDLGEPLR